jgi:hypothetical protein
MARRHRDLHTTARFWIPCDPQTGRTRRNESSGARLEQTAWIRSRLAVRSHHS